jgi:SNF2 family DNA or RNA helicase
MAKWEFEAAFCEIANTSYGAKIIGARNMTELHERLDPVISRIRRKDTLDLPSIRIDSWPLDVETTGGLALSSADEARELLGSLVEQYGDLSQLDRDANFVETYLTCIEQNAAVIARARQQTATLKAGATAIMLREEAEAAGRSQAKTVVFAHHREAIDVLTKHLRTQGVVVIHGGVDPGARQEIIDQFQGNPAIKFAVLQIKAAGASVNVQGASNVVFVEASWVPGENEQAIARVYRHGQKNPVYVRYVYLPGSVDELVNRAIARKMAMIW